LVKTAVEFFTSFDQAVIFLVEFAAPLLQFVFGLTRDFERVILASSWTRRASSVAAAMMSSAVRLRRISRLLRTVVTIMVAIAAPISRAIPSQI